MIEVDNVEIIHLLGAICELRSLETDNHIKRLTKYCKLLGEKAGLKGDDLELLTKAAALHDVGKANIPDSLLLKPGKLTDEEFDIMKSHSKAGYDVLIKCNDKVLQTAAIIAYEHHEKYNGKGYPRGLKGTEISLNARIVAICDVFDSLGSDRCYKKAWSLEKILTLLVEERNEHFDPDLVDLFIESLPEILEIKDMYVD